MTVVSSREQYLDVGLEVLADRGYGGLKLTEVCRRLGVTTGSFYHRFAGWSEFTRELGGYWADTQNEHRMDRLQKEPDPRRRLEQLARAMTRAPHRTEAAIRTWAAVDPDVRALLAEVDEKRLDDVTTIIMGVLPDQHDARRFASWAIYLLIGYQDALVDSDLDALVWATDRVMQSVYTEAPADTAWWT